RANTTDILWSGARHARMFAWSNQVAAIDRSTRSRPNPSMAMGCQSCVARAGSYGSTTANASKTSDAQRSPGNWPWRAATQASTMAYVAATAVPILGSNAAASIDSTKVTTARASGGTAHAEFASLASANAPTTGAS